MYRLHIFGPPSGVQGERLHFHTLADAVESVVGRITDDHNGWTFKDDKIVLVDHNNGGPNVIHKIERDFVDEEHVKVHTEPVYSPQ